jgi:ankyrin repeat protein
VLVVQVKELLPADAATAPAAPSSSAAASASSTRIHVNVCDSEGFTPLIVAALHQREDVVRYLLSLPGVSVNAHTRLYNTAFLYACAKGNATIARMLLEGGANFGHTNINSDNCLLNACAAGSEPTVKFLLEAFHDIQKAKAQHFGLSAAGGSGAAAATGGSRKCVTLRNEEGLTTLMCAVMSGCVPLVRLILAEARQELGVVIPGKGVAGPSARVHFFPSIWPEVLGGALQFDSQAYNGYVDPAPPAFLAFVNAQNVSGDTALHIAAQQQREDLFTLLIENAGADPGRTNRRGKLAVHLFELSSSAAAKDGDASSGQSIPASVGRLAAHWKTLVDFQSARRAEYLARMAAQSDKLFSELMDEEEEAQARSVRKAAKQSATGAAAKKKAKAAKAKKGEATTTAAAVSESSSPSSSPRLAATASPSSSSTAAAAASSVPSLSPTAAPFVPATADAATTTGAAGDWEVVVPKAAKKAAAAASATAPSAATAPASSSSSSSAAAANSAVPQEKKMPASAKQTKSQKANEKKPAVSSSAAPATTSAAAAASSAAATATPSSAVGPAPPPAAPTVAPPASASASRTAAASPVRLPYTLVPVASAATAAPAVVATTTAAAVLAAPAAAAAGAGVMPTPSSPFFAAFTTRPRTAWRPITALQRRTVGPGEAAPAAAAAASSSSLSSGASSSSPTPSAAAAAAASSSAAETLASLQSQLQSLHPHVESTDLQLSHVLGADWGGLSMSQLSVLDEVYAGLSRQIRDAQFQLLFHAQTQDVLTELGRTRSELHALRKEVASIKEGGGGGVEADKAD